MLYLKKFLPKKFRLTYPSHDPHMTHIPLHMTSSHDLSHDPNGIPSGTT